MINIFFIILICSVGLGCTFTAEQELQVNEINRILLAKTWYEVLQVPQTASDTSVNESFKQKSLLVHPDKVGWDSGVEKNATLAFQKLSEAKKRNFGQEVGHDSSREAASFYSKKISVDIYFFRKIFDARASDQYLSPIFMALQKCAGAINRWETRDSSLSDDQLIDLKKEVIAVFTEYFKLIINLSPEWPILKQISSENGRHGVCLIMLISDYLIFSENEFNSFTFRIDKGDFTKLVMKFFHDFLKNHCGKKMPTIAGLNGDGVSSLEQYKIISGFLLNISRDNFFDKHETILTLGAGVLISAGGVCCLFRKQVLKKCQKVSKDKKLKQKTNDKRRARK